MLLEVKNVSKKYNNRYILKDVSFSIKKGEFFSIVGKSGIGKSTLAKIIMGIISKDSGTILFEGKDISKRNITDIQMIFQDPYSSLNEAMTVYEIIAEPLIVNNIPDVEKKVFEMLELLGISQLKDKYPDNLSGGQRQRVVVGAAMITKPKLIICDEPLSALDLSIQNQIVKLLQFFKQKYNTSYIFISHDIELVTCISDKIYEIGGKYDKKD